MLEVKNLVKIYKPKKGVPVRALDNVSIRFPEKGMVFLLGKSGSGKSTLLNVLGGLDRLNSGEILIKGKSSISFRQKHFDSYRNTYVGFIFQEYNILDEFTVGANVALALQLQGRKATNEAINGILKEVDLNGYGNRKPNELSGGQKQRVAIARALVKGPEIIMADEPTGALDSVTGRQVLDTLKKLSKEKLVIVVSHDREFAEKYADRIIELADGRIISDMEYSDNAAEPESEGIIFSGNTLTLPEAYELTEEDRLRINEYIRALKGGKVTLSFAEGNGSSGRKSVKTDESKIILQNNSGFKLIKSRLPMKYAFKMGASGLKLKKFRLVITILLSCIAFGLFGLADTFGSFNYITTCSQSLIDSNISYASFSKAVKEYYIGSDEYYFSTYMARFTKEEIATLNKDTPVDVRGVYNPHMNDYININSYLGSGNMMYFEDSIYSTVANGYIEIDKNFINDTGAKLVYGDIPSGDKDEIAISLYLAQSFVKFGYVDFDAFQNGELLDKNEAQTISSPKQLIGKTLFNKTIVGIVDTNVDLERYKPAYVSNSDASTADMLLQYALMNEFEELKNYSLACLIMVGDGYIENMMASDLPVYPSSNGISVDSPEHNYSNYFSYLGDITKVGEGTIQYIGSIEYKTKGIALPRYVALDLARVMWDTGEFGDRDDTYYEYPSDEELLSLLANTNITLSTEEMQDGTDAWFDGYTHVELTDMRVVAVFDESLGEGLILCDESYIKRWCEIAEGDFVMALGSMPKNRSDIVDLVAYCDGEHNDMRYEMNNTVVFELSALRELLEILAPIFLYIGLGFALFASLMLSNFITMSISNKKREIGILRAIGSRGNDVFRIFFSESFIIAMINFVLTSTALVAIVTLINTALRQNTGLLITALTIGPRQIILEFLVSLLVAIIASYIPVKRIASKKPIDAIKDI